MKNIVLPALLFLLCISFINCDETKDALDVNFTTNISTTMSVAAATTDEDTYSIVLNATSDPEIQKYADKIKNVEVTKLVIAIENYQYKDEDAEIYFNGELGFGSVTASTPSGTCEISFLNITHVKNTGEFEINDCNNQLSNIASKLLADNAVKVFLIGSVTAAPMSFDMKIVATVKITANPL